MNLDFFVNPTLIYCIQLQNIDIKTLSYHLSQLFFYSSPSFIHYHYNNTDNERMLLISEESLSVIENFSNNITKKYNSVQIMNTNEYIDDIGLVAKISNLFSQNNISILYITTMQNNFVLFENSNYNKAIEILEKLTL